MSIYDIMDEFEFIFFCYFTYLHLLFPILSFLNIYYKDYFNLASNSFGTLANFIHVKFLHVHFKGEKSPLILFHMSH